MRSKIAQLVSLPLAILFVFAAGITANQNKSIQLPDPRMEGGRPLMEVLQDRNSARQFSSKELSAQVVSNLLWAAWGVNRPDSGKRTAPSARNKQEIEIYISRADGLFLYNAQAHTLDPISGRDIRAFTGKQEFVKDAPLNLIFVVDYSKLGDTSPEKKIFYSAIDTGYISQNVYLFSASEGLATVARAWLDKPLLEKKMGLPPNKKVVLAQTVGYPAKGKK